MVLYTPEVRSNPNALFLCVPLNILPAIYQTTFDNRENGGIVYLYAFMRGVIYI